MRKFADRAKYVNLERRRVVVRCARDDTALGRTRADTEASSRARYERQGGLPLRYRKQASCVSNLRDQINFQSKIKNVYRGFVSIVTTILKSRDQP